MGEGFDGVADEDVVTAGTAFDTVKAGRGDGGAKWVSAVSGRATTVAVFDGCGVAGGVGCGEGLTTTTRGAESADGGDGS